MQRSYHRHLVPIQRDGIVLAVLIDGFLAGDKRQGFHLAFQIFIFAFVDAQPEHDQALSAGPAFGFSHADNSVLAFCAKNLAESGCGFTGY